MSVTVRWLGQGGFLFECGSARLCIDPYLSDACSNRRLVPPPYEPEALPASTIVCTHAHDDHLDLPSLARTDKARHAYAGPPSCCARMRDIGIPGDRMRALHVGDALDIGGDMRIHAVYADHTEDSIGVVIDTGGLRIYVTGDTLDHARLRDVGPVDVLFVVINGRLGNMTCAQAVQLAKDLPAAVAVPCHYGMFAENTADPGAFDAGLAGSGVRTGRLELGACRDVRALGAGTNEA